MNAMALRVLIPLAALLAALAASLYVEKLRTDLKAAQQAEQTARQGNADRDATIRELNRFAQQNDQARTRLDADRAGILSDLAKREALIRDLQDANKEINDWSSVRLPGVIIGMREHPALTGAAAYRARLSGSDALHTSGGSGEE